MFQHFFSCQHVPTVGRSVARSARRLHFYSQAASSTWLFFPGVYCDFSTNFGWNAHIYYIYICICIYYMYIYIYIYMIIYCNAHIYIIYNYMFLEFKVRIVLASCVMWGVPEMEMGVIHDLDRGGVPPRVHWKPLGPLCSNSL